MDKPAAILFIPLILRSGFLKISSDGIDRIYRMVKRASILFIPFILSDVFFCI